MIKTLRMIQGFIIKKEKWCKIVLAVLLGLYVFTFMTFGSIAKLYLLVYPVLALLGATSIICFLALKKEINELLYLLIPILFIVCAFLSTLLGTKSFSSLKTVALLTISFYVVYATCVVIGDFKTILFALAISSFSFFLAFAIICFKDIIRLKIDRIGSFFGNVNDVGIHLFFAMATTLTFSLFYKKYYLTPLSFLCMIGSLLTASRKAVILTIVFLLFVLIYFFRKKPIILIIILGAFALSIVALFCLPFLSFVKERVVDTFGYFFGKSDDGTTSTRFLYVENSIYLGVKNFVFGIGSDGFRQLTDFGKYSHNNLGEVLCNFGLVGVLLFYAPAVIFSIHIVNIKKEEFVFTILFLLFIVVSSFSLVILDSKIYFVLLGICYSIFLSKTNLFIERYNSINI